LCSDPPNRRPAHQADQQSSETEQDRKASHWHT
jgi:hypothetical protein